MTDDELETLIEDIEKFIVDQYQINKIPVLNLTAVFLSRIALLSVECRVQKEFMYLLNSIANSVEKLAEEEKKVTLQ